MAGFLRAAASVVAEMGYERTTMSAIAKRARSSIGSLYQFFPNKPSVAEALRAQYVKDIEQSWTVLARKAAALSAGHLAGRLASMQIELVKSHPALLALLDVPPTAHTPARRELIRVRIATVLMAHKPRMSRAMALRVASVVQQVSRALLTLYAQTDPGEKFAMIEEFKSVLTGYLTLKLKC
ncbi:MAG: TetR/AcrR family transcriptional regulator [Candidatus Acidiferrales bacterium]